MPLSPATAAQSLDIAWHWLCRSRAHFPPNADIWDLRFRWSAYRDTFLHQLETSTYRLSPMQCVGSAARMLWSSADALALKWLELRIQTHLPVHPRCEHVKGHGGGPASVQRLVKQLTHIERPLPWVCRTDIKGYYANIDKTRLLQQLYAHIKHPAYRTLLNQYVHYSVEKDGLFHTPKKGIPRGCALSPLMGAFHLYTLDAEFASKKVFYIRYMDDFILLTQTRGQLRKAVKCLNQRLQAFGFTKHPDKTFIGRVSKGFDWMGAWLTDKGITGVAPRALKNHRERCRQLYEQTSRLPAKQQAMRVSQYRARWLQWVQCVLNGPKSANRVSPHGEKIGRSIAYLTTQSNPTFGTQSHSTLRSRRRRQPR